MKISRVALFLPILLSACSNPPAPVPPLDYGQLGKINLDVKDLDFVDRGIDVTPPDPVVNDQFSPTIAEAIHSWASQRLQAVGVRGSAAFIVKNAYVTEESTPGEGVRKYVGHAEIGVEARGNEGEALATANATRTVTLPGDPDPEEKAEAYRAMLNGLMQDIDHYLDEAIQNHMKDFIVNAPLIGAKLPPAPAVPESPDQSP